MTLKHVGDMSGSLLHVVLGASQGGNEAAEAVRGKNEGHLVALQHREGLLDNLERHKSVVIGGGKQVCKQQEAWRVSICE